MAIHRRKFVEIPKGTFLNSINNKGERYVYLYVRHFIKNGKNRSESICIGLAIDEKMMHPNDTYLDMIGYPKLNLKNKKQPRK